MLSRKIRPTVAHIFTNISQTINQKPWGNQGDCCIMLHLIFITTSKDKKSFQTISSQDLFSECSGATIISPVLQALIFKENLL